MPLTIRFIVNLLALVSLLALSGCQTAMPTSQESDTRTPVPNEWPLRFEKHSFSAHCYDTIGCSVLYNKEYLVQDAADKVRSSSESIGPNYQKGWGTVTYGGIKNFPAPAVVAWKSKDGASHEAVVDVAEIFRDQHILHHVSREDLPTETVATAGDPTIILEVNNRTINVYMREVIYLKDTESRRNESRDDVILAYSRTY